MSRRQAWVGVNIVGFALAAAAFGAIQRAREQQYYEVVTSAARAVRIESVNTAESLALFGAIVGSLQWLVLRRTGARWWIAVTAAGWATAGILLGVVSGLAFGAVSSIGPSRDWPVMLAAGAAGAAALLLPGTLQWLALRPRPAAKRWPLVAAAGLAMGIAAGGVVVRWGLVDLVPWLTPEDFPSARALVCVGAVAGTGYGALTAPTIERLDRLGPSAYPRRRTALHPG